MHVRSYVRDCNTCVPSAINTKNSLYIFLDTQRSDITMVAERKRQDVVLDIDPYLVSQHGCINADGIARSVYINTNLLMP